MVVRVYANGKDQWVQDLQSALDEQCDVVEVPPIQMIQREPAQWPDRGVVLFFTDGGGSPTPQDVQELKEHVEAGRQVIPAIGRAEDARHLPAPLSTLNAFVLGRHASWAAALAD